VERSGIQKVAPPIWRVPADGKTSEARASRPRNLAVAE
jgi:hypothetical protein